MLNERGRQLQNQYIIPDVIGPRNQHMQDWIDALRSGRYEQGNSMLRTRDDKYCCLGVACDVAGLEWRQVPAYIPSWTVKFGGFDNTAFMPTSLGELMGLTYRYQEFLASLNDSGHSFNDIAEWLEDKFPVEEAGGTSK